MKLKKFSLILFILIISIIPNFCFADDYIEENYYDIYPEIEVSSSLSEFPNINARHAVVIDRASKAVLFGKNENEQCKMASTTKIMTAIIVLENCSNLNETITVSAKAARNRWFKIRST